MHLSGKFENRVFDERDVSFTVGEGSEANVVDGVERAVEKMKKGETARLVIKSQYAFGAEGNQELGIPPNAVVEYTVTLKTFEKVSFINYNNIFNSDIVLCNLEQRKLGS